MLKWPLVALIATVQGISLTAYYKPPTPELIEKSKEDAVSTMVARRRRATRPVTPDRPKREDWTVYTNDRTCVRKKFSEGGLTCLGAPSFNDWPVSGHTVKSLLSGNQAYKLIDDNGNWKKLYSGPDADHIRSALASDVEKENAFLTLIPTVDVCSYEYCPRRTNGNNHRPVSNAVVSGSENQPGHPGTDPSYDASYSCQFIRTAVDEDTNFLYAHGMSCTDACQVADDFSTLECDSGWLFGGGWGMQSERVEKDGVSAWSNGREVFKWSQYGVHQWWQACLEEVINIIANVAADEDLHEKFTCSDSGFGQPTRAAVDAGTLHEGQGAMPEGFAIDTPDILVQEYNNPMAYGKGQSAYKPNFKNAARYYPDNNGRESTPDGNNLTDWSGAQKANGEPTYWYPPVIWEPSDKTMVMEMSKWNPILEPDIQSKQPQDLDLQKEMYPAGMNPHVSSQSSYTMENDLMNTKNFKRPTYEYDHTKPDAQHEWAFDTSSDVPLSAGGLPAVDMVDGGLTIATIPFVDGDGARKETYYPYGDISGKIYDIDNLVRHKDAKQANYWTGEVGATTLDLADVADTNAQISVDRAHFDGPEGEDVVLTESESWTAIQKQRAYEEVKWLSADYRHPNPKNSDGTDNDNYMKWDITNRRNPSAGYNWAPKKYEKEPIVGLPQGWENTRPGEHLPSSQKGTISGWGHARKTNQVNRARPEALAMSGVYGVTWISAKEVSSAAPSVSPCIAEPGMFDTHRCKSCRLREDLKADACIAQREDWGVCACKPYAG